MIPPLCIMSAGPNVSHGQPDGLNHYIGDVQVPLDVLSNAE